VFNFNPAKPATSCHIGVLESKNSGNKSGRDKNKERKELMLIKEKYKCVVGVKTDG